MEILKEMVSVLFDKETILKVNQQYQTKSKRVAIDAQNMSFRLFLSDAGTINLELLMRDNYGFYFKPIGYYEFTPNGIKNIYVLREFEEAYTKIKHSIEYDLANKVNFLDVESNSFIAMCSREASNVTKEIFRGNLKAPQQLISNGIKIIIFNSMMNSLEVKNIDEDYETDKDIFVLYTENEIKWGEEPLCDLLYRKGLFSALNID
ncbi:hypothetical protein AB4865_02410 [Capnocytophaga sp. ARDL2]|uniref:hypothetical protein n=1 Tax=Capnocytophaga sp. ARDL2 TaxID=3238809 RepID=UPI0035580650